MTHPIPWETIAFPHSSSHAGRLAMLLPFISDRRSVIRRRLAQGITRRRISYELYPYMGRHHLSPTPHPLSPLSSPPPPRVPLHPVGRQPSGLISQCQAFGYRPIERTGIAQRVLAIKVRASSITHNADCSTRRSHSGV